MAAPMNSPPARIALSFDNPSLENCWFVVDFSRHSFIEDIEIEVKKKFFNTSTDDSRIVLRLNNFRLPSSESSILLRDNDIVSVSVENCDNDIHINQTKKAKKRKYKDVCVTDNPRDDSDHVVEPKKSKKKKKTLVEEEVTDDTNQTINESTNVGEGDGAEALKCESRKKSKKLLNEEKLRSRNVVEEIRNEHVEDKGDAGYMKEDCSDSKNSLTDTQCEPEDGTVDAGDDDQSITKSTRKRHRKRKRRNRSHDVKSEKVENLENIVVDTVVPYKGRDIVKDEIFYGSLPDKLESPRNYRHGYRNLQSYQVQSNKHKKFGSESESDEESNANTEQYNFLCKKRENLTAHTEVSAPFESVMRSDSSIAMKGDDISTPESNKLSNFSAYNGNHSSSSFPNHFHSPVSTNQAEVCEVESTKHLNNIPDANDATSHVNVKETGSTLMRKTLSNGVAVFVRQRSPRNEFRVQSKEEQLNTSSTHVSTVFKNPEPTEFKVPVSPAIKHTPMFAARVESIAATNTDGCTWKNKDLSTFPLLKTCPKQGDIIAYKVLEISMNLTPEVSSHKVAKVISVGHNEMLELKTLKHSETGSQNDKFHIHMETDDEVLTNVADSDLAVLHFSSLLETRSLS